MSASRLWRRSPWFIFFLVMAAAVAAFLGHRATCKADPNAMIRLAVADPDTVLGRGLGHRLFMPQPYPDGRELD